jgi:predicted helicase
MTWQELLSLPASKRAPAMRETDARTINKAASAIDDNTTTLPPIASLKLGSMPVEPRRYAFRSFDRQWMLPDTRLCDRPRPELQRAHGSHQIYITSLLTEVFGEGSAAIATALTPDLHHYRGSFGGAHVIPLWRDKDAKQPNLAGKLLDTLSAVYGEAVAAEDLFAYCYALLSTPAYIDRHWDELTIPGPRVPIAKEPALFKRGAALGKHLLWLHTFGERFVPAGKKPGRLPPGSADRYWHAH